MSVTREFDHDGERLRVQLENLGGDRYRVSVGDRTHEVTAARLPDGRVRFALDGEVHDAAAGPVGTARGDLHVKLGDESFVLRGHGGGVRDAAMGMRLPRVARSSRR